MKGNGLGLTCQALGGTGDRKSMCLGWNWAGGGGGGKGQGTGLTGRALRGGLHTAATSATAHATTCTRWLGRFTAVALVPATHKVKLTHKKAKCS